MWKLLLVDDEDIIVITSYSIHYTKLYDFGTPPYPMVLLVVVVHQVAGHPPHSIGHIPGDAHRLTMKTRHVLAELPIVVVHREQLVPYRAFSLG